MSDLIRMIGMKMSHNGTCRKCGSPRDKGSHKSCDRFSRGFHYVANSRETTLAELKEVVGVICQGDSDDTPVQFDIRIRQRQP